MCVCIKLVWYFCIVVVIIINIRRILSCDVTINLLLLIFCSSAFTPTSSVLVNGNNMQEYSTCTSFNLIVFRN